MSLLSLISIIRAKQNEMNDWEKRRRSTHSFQCGRSNRGVSGSSDVWRYCSHFSSGDKNNLGSVHEGGFHLIVWSLLHELKKGLVSERR